MFVRQLIIIAKRIRSIKFYISATQPGVSNPKIPIKRVTDHGFKTAPDGRFIITDGNEKASDTEETNKKKAPFLEDDLEEDDYGKALLFRNCVNDIPLNAFIHFVEDKDDISIADKNTNRKRKYNESASDVMSLKSQSTSKYRGTFTNLSIRDISESLILIF